MASLKQRLRRKNSSGSYDIIYLQSDLSNVTGTLGITNGGTGAITASAALSALGAAASSHNHDATAITYGSSSNVSAEIDDLKTSVSEGKSLIAAAVTDKNVPTAVTDSWNTIAANIGLLGAYMPYPEWYITVKNASIGDVITIDENQWILVNKSVTAVVLGLQYSHESTIFGNSIYANYAGSILSNRAGIFETTELSSDTLSYINEVSIENVTAKVWVPTKDQVYGESGIGSFEYYNSDNNRICYDKTSTPTIWWTSSRNTRYERYLYAIGYGGYIINDRDQSDASGFRPHIEVNLTL